MDIYQTDTYKKIHFAVMAIEASAKKAHLSGKEMHDRLKRQGLIRKRLFRHYEQLHTQSLEWVADDTIETLHNWEQEEKESGVDRNGQISDVCGKHSFRFGGGRTMRDAVLWRKQSHIIMMLAEALKVDAEQALDLFYSTKTYQQLSNPKYCLQLMSDQYIVDDVLMELRHKGYDTRAGTGHQHATGTGETMYDVGGMMDDVGWKMADVWMNLQTQYDLDTADIAKRDNQRETVAVTIPVRDRNLLQELVRKFGWACML